MGAVLLVRRNSSLPSWFVPSVSGDADEREETIAERAVVLSVDGVLRPALSELKSSIRMSSASSRTLEEVEREHIVNVLKETMWVIGGPDGAAKRLGINRSTLTFRMRKLGIVRSSLCR